MKRVLVALMLATGGVALAAPPPEPAPPIGKRTEDVRGRPHPLAPIPFFYRQLDMDRQNVGLNGRVNATRDAARAAETPSLPMGPFGDFGGW